MIIIINIINDNDDNEKNTNKIDDNASKIK